MITTPLIGLLFAMFAVEEPKTSTLLEEMNKRITSFHTLEYDFIMDERWCDKMIHAESHTKINIKPFAVYIKFTKASTPAKEIIYNPALYGNKTAINLGKFLPNMSFSPTSSKMRNEQHHTVLDAGLGKLNHILYSSYKQNATTFDANCTVVSTEHQGLKAWKIIINDLGFGYVNHVVKQGETIPKIAVSKRISEYLILDKNKLKNYEDIKVGQVLKVPTTYCKKVVLFIEKDSYMPIHQEIYDEVGLFEKYEYKNIKINKPFPEMEFNKEYSAYGF